MPYELKKVKKDKFKVCKKDDKKVCFSKKGLPKKTAIKQKYAIEQSERRRFGMGRTDGRSTDSHGPKDNDRFYKQYLKKMKKTSYTPFNRDDFVNDFDAIFNSKNIDINDTIDEVVESTKKFRDDDERSQIDTDDDEEEKVKAKSRTSSNVSELTMDSDDDAFDYYEQSLIDYNGLDGVIPELDVDEFEKRYAILKNNEPDFDKEQIIDQIIADQEIELYGTSTESEREDLAEKISLAVGFMDDFSQFPDFETETIISADDIHDGRTTSRYVNYKNLKEMYEYILKKCKENTKGGFCGWMVNGRDSDMTATKNYRILNSLVFLTEQLNQGRYSIWCKDKCSEEQWNFDLFRNPTFGIVFKHQGDEIMMSAGCKLSTHSNSLYIELLCGLGGGKYIMDAFRRLYNQGSEDDLWEKINKYNYLSLGSVSSYITVMFYYKQGLIEEERTIDLVMEAFETEIKERIDNGDYANFVEYCEEKLPYFLSGDCETDDQYLNDIFTACSCGGSKYLYPDVKVKLNETRVKKGNETLVSYDYLKGFADYCKDVIANPSKYAYSRADKIKEGVMEVFENLPAKARALRTEKLRTKRMLRNPDLPRENLINQRFVNEQIRNTLTELEESGLPAGENSQSVDRLANKPRFVEQRMGLDQRQRQTAINRLEGNEPRTKYKRMNQLREFGMPSVRNVALDPFDTRQNLVPDTIRRNGKIRMIEPPQKAPFTTQDPIITVGDPRQGRGVKGTKFYEELKGYGIDPIKYLAYMKKQAKKAGYDEKQLTIDNDDKHKLRISTEDGVKHFGAVGYKDNFIYTHLEKTKKVPKGTAKQMRDRFQKSHGAITTKRKLGRNSANELALKILW
jgi:hypothetical protein